jgi:hypothetical protein
MLYTSLSSLSVSRLCRAFAHDGDGDDHGGYQAGRVDRPQSDKHRLGRGSK